MGLHVDKFAYDFEKAFDTVPHDWIINDYLDNVNMILTF